MIDVSSLCKRFGRFRAVDNISFTVEPGQVLGFLGPNGAGKSTTMKLITGYDKPTSGRITVNGRDVQRHRKRMQADLGYLPEGAPAYGDMTVEHYLDFIARARGLASRDRQGKLRAVTAQLELDGVRTQRIDTLSKGFKRRVGIAQALVHDPSVLILDEPTDGLDPNQKHQVRDLIRGVAADKTVILSTHILEEVEAVCHRALIIAEGKVLVDSTPDALRRQSRYCGAITLELPDARRSAAALEALPEADSVEFSLDNPNRFTVIPKPNTNLYVAIDQQLKARGWIPAAMGVDPGRLDDVFRKVTKPDSVEVQL
ncbi:MAG: ABC transporter ATP-binding protein [Pseudomonadota bacterium]